MKLKPCPFCGKKPEVMKETEKVNYFVGCVNYRECSVIPIPFVVYNTINDAIDAWNKRPKEVSNESKRTGRTKTAKGRRSKR